MQSAIAAIRQQVIAEMKTQQPLAAPVRRLLTAAQAGEFGRTESAIRQMIYKKQVPVVRIGRSVRIDVRDLDALINDCRM
jgi:hypothetical protein